LGENYLNEEYCDVIYKDYGGISGSSETVRTDLENNSPWRDFGNLGQIREIEGKI